MTFAESIKPTALHRLSVIRVVLLLALTCVALCSPAHGSDSDVSSDALPGSYRILSDDGKIEIPFDLFRGDIRYQCEINGRKVHMLLDDGYMWDQLLFWGGPEVDSLGFTYDGEIGVGEKGSDQLVSKTASGITVTFPDVEFTDQTAIVTPSSSGNAGMWWGSVGQISASFFRHFVVDINFDNMVITLIEPDKFHYQGSGVSVPWQPMGYGPWSIPATLGLEDGTSTSMKVMMDLGYNDQLLVSVGKEHNITLPKEKLATGLGSNILGHETRGYIGRLTSIDIGGYSVTAPIVSFKAENSTDRTSGEAMIGLGLLSRFNLVFDYNRRLLYVDPNESFDQPFEHIMTGFVLGPPTEGHRVIRKVHDQSPASEAGLKEGDTIVKINDRMAGDYDYFELVPLFTREGEVIRLLVQRDGQQEQISLKLQRII